MYITYVLDQSKTFAAPEILKDVMSPDAFLQFSTFQRKNILKRNYPTTLLLLSSCTRHGNARRIMGLQVRTRARSSKSPWPIKEPPEPRARRLYSRLRGQLIIIYTTSSRARAITRGRDRMRAQPQRAVNMHAQAEVVSAAVTWPLPAAGSKG